jgi:hypothetical protein
MGQIPRVLCMSIQLSMIQLLIKSSNKCAKSDIAVIVHGYMLNMNFVTSKTDCYLRLF